MRGTRYTAEFKAEAIKQITERGHGDVEVSKRLGVSIYQTITLYPCVFKKVLNYINLVMLEVTRIKVELF